MKTKNQIIRNISRLQFSDDDWTAVRKYFTAKYGRGINKPQSPKHSATFKWVLEWENSGFGSGDMVWWNNDRAVVSYETPNHVYLCAVMDNFRLIIYDRSFPAVKHQDLKPMTPEESADFLSIISNEGYNINQRSGLLLGKPALIEGKLYNFEHNGKEYVGAIKNCPRNSDIVTFMFGYGDVLIAENMDIDRKMIGESLGMEAQQQLNDSLRANYNLEWDKRAGKLVPKLDKLPKGGVYYYINDRFNVVTGHENGEIASKTRRECFNYFKDYETARKIAFTIREEAKKLQLPSQATVIEKL